MKNPKTPSKPKRRRTLTRKTQLEVRSLVLDAELSRLYLLDASRNEKLYKEMAKLEKHRRVNYID